MSKSKSPTSITNPRAKFDYELIDKFVAGIALFGHEAKSLRFGDGNLRGAYVNLVKGELWLIGAYIAPYKHSGQIDDYDPNRTRKLLLNKNELKKLAAAKNQKLTIVPTKLLIGRRYIKLELATARGRKKHDKREYILKRQHRRDTGSR